MEKEDIKKFKEDIRKLIEKNVLIKIETKNKKIAMVNIHFSDEDDTIDYKLKIDFFSELYYSQKIIKKKDQLYFDFSK